MKKLPKLVLLMATLVMSTTAFGVDESEMREMRKAIEQLRNDYEARIQALEGRLKQAETAAAQVKPVTDQVQVEEEESPLDAAVADAEEEIEAVERKPAGAPRSDIWSRRVGGADVRIIDLGVNIMTASGGSSASADDLEDLQGGAHDPQRNGFTLQQAEFVFKGAIDPYLTGESYVIASEDGLELEEAFFTTTSLPYDLQLEGGFFLSEFGIINPTHPHSWNWIDQPVVNTRLFSGDGQRAAGFRASKLLPVDWYSEFHIGSQDPTAETMTSFMGEGHSHGEEDHGEEDEEHGDEGVGGYARVKDSVNAAHDLTWLARWVNSWDVNSSTTAKLGLTGLFGANSTGNTGYTTIYGADLKVKWVPANNFRGYPFLTWQSEVMNREYKVDKDNPEFVQGETDGKLHDWGFYTYLLYGFTPRWAVGVRGEFASGSNRGPEARDDDPLRADRVRVSPMIAWKPTEFSRFRLQYNYDDSDHLSTDSHTVWLGADVLFGSHPPHAY